MRPNIPRVKYNEGHKKIPVPNCRLPYYWLPLHSLNMVPTLARAPLLPV